MGREVSWLKAFHLNRKVHSFQKPLGAHPGLSTEPSYKGSDELRVENGLNAVIIGIIRLSS